MLLHIDGLHILLKMVTATATATAITITDRTVHQGTTITIAIIVHRVITMIRMIEIVDHRRNIMMMRTQEGHYPLRIPPFLPGRHRQSPIHTIAPFHLLTAIETSDCLRDAGPQVLRLIMLVDHNALPMSIHIFLAIPLRIHIQDRLGMC